MIGYPMNVRQTPSQVPTEELERSLMFNTGFQSSVAIARNMEYAVGALTANRDFLRELQRELDGKVGGDKIT